MHSKISIVFARKKKTVFSIKNLLKLSRKINFFLLKTKGKYGKLKGTFNTTIGTFVCFNSCSYGQLCTKLCDRCNENENQKIKQKFAIWNLICVIYILTLENCRACSMQLMAQTKSI